MSVTLASPRLRPDRGPDPSPAVVRRYAAVCALAMLAVGWWRIDRGSLWYDEAASHWAARLPPSQLFRLLLHVDAVHAAFYLLLRSILALDDSETALRVPALLGMTGAAACTAALGARLTGRPHVGLSAGLIFAVLPFTSHYAQEGRSYGLVCCCVTGAGLLLLRAVDGSGGWRAYGITMAIVAILNLMALLALLAHAIYLRRQASTAWRSWTRTVRRVLIAVAPLMFVSALQTGQLPVRDLGWTTPLRLAGSLFGPVIPTLVVTGGLALVAVRRSRRHSDLVNFVVPLLIAPAGVLLLVAVWKPSFYSERYLCYVAPAVALLVAGGLDAMLRPARFRTAAAILTATVIFAASFGEHERLRSSAGRMDDFGGAARVLSAQTRPGDVVLYAETRFRMICTAYPEACQHLDDVALDRPPQQAGTLAGTERPAAAIQAALRTPRRAWLIGKTPSDTTPYLGTDWRHRRTIVVHGVSLTLWTRT